MTSLADIFRTGKLEYDLTLFDSVCIKEIEARLIKRNDKFAILCLASDKERPAKPEEIVRQLWIKKLLEEFHYPKERIKVEQAVWFGSAVSDKSADIIVMHKDGEHPYIIFEVKKPKRKEGIKQLRSYCNAEGSPIGVWSNGKELVILHRKEPNIFAQISSIPTVDQSIQDVVKEPWTIEKLTSENKLVRERSSLKKLIEDLEDLVLANAEGIDDSFDEIFKLIYAKLYDEWAAINDRSLKGRIHFRTYGESPQELYQKISGLFYKARNKWPGVFNIQEEIKLKPSHLQTCVSFLQDIKLFNANLQVIDEAFEYLSTEVSKGKKGQYFTPRWVIDMCVKMLNPKIHERVIDPACGSSGFTVHCIFWIANEQFSAHGLPNNAIEYARENVYAIDSSPVAVKIAKAINLIAGDGRTNVYEMNSLNPRNWPPGGRDAFKNFLFRYIQNRSKDDENQREFQYFNFDILMTNPPFAGNINERDTLKQYQLAEKKGQTIARMGRDILFVERCLNFIRPGGRMAIILPQGRLNNINDLFIRNFIFDKARILATVSLHSNTFKPHTGTKTSILFLQKYTEIEYNKIQNTINRHIATWNEHLQSISTLSEKNELSEEDFPPILLSFLNAEFTIEDKNESEPELSTVNETEEELIERIADLEQQSLKMVGRVKGRSEIRRAIAKTKYKLAGKSLIGQLKWLLTDQKLLSDYKRMWLSDKSIEELDYPIFFALSHSGGKNNSGDPVYKKDIHGDPLVDKHGHLIIEHDLDEIADEFIKFAKEQNLDFWS